MKLRKGFTLVELLVVVTVIPIAAIALNRLFTAFIRDIPRSSEVVYENTTVLNMLKQMRKDIDKAINLPQSFKEHTAGDELLLIEQPDGVICYQIKRGQVLRYKLMDTKEAGVEDEESWSVPNAEIMWQVWRKEGKGFAVEISTYVKQKLREKLQKKMANSHIYFVGIY